MDDLLAVEVGEAVQDTLSYLAQDLLTSPTTKLLDFSVNAVKGTTFAEFHGNADGGGRRLHKRTIVSTNMITSTILIESQFSHNLLLDIWIWVGRDDLESIRRASYILSYYEP